MEPIRHRNRIAQSRDSSGIPTVKKLANLSIVVLALIVGYFAGYYQLVLSRLSETEPLEYREITLPVSARDHEPVWSKSLADLIGGEAEYRLRDRSRVDVLTSKYAIEVDWLDKWHQGIGQALHYSYLSGKEPVVAIGIKEEDYNKDKLEMAKRVANKNGIGVWVLRPE